MEEYSRSAGGGRVGGEGWVGAGLAGRRGRRRCRLVGGCGRPRPAPPAVARPTPPPRGSAASAALRSPTGLWPSMAWKRHTSTSGLHTTVSSAGLVAASPGPLSPGAPPPPTSASPMARAPSDEPPAGAGAVTASAQAHLRGRRALGGFALGPVRGAGAGAGAAEGRPPRRPLAAGPRGAARSARADCGSAPVGRWWRRLRLSGFGP